MARSNYFMGAIASAVGGLVLLALGCVLCCGGCLPGDIEQQLRPQNEVEPIIVDDLPVERRAP